MKRLLIFILVSSLCLVAQVASATTNPVFYKVTKQGNTAYLLGSIHVGNTDFYPLTPVIESTFTASDALVIEADITKANVAQLLQRFGMIEPDMMAKANQVTAKYCQDKQVICQSLQGFAPWLQASQISMARFAQLGYLPDHGVDLFLQARHGTKPLYELESVAFQFDLISSFSEQTQLTMLDEAVNASDEEMLALINAWRQGDKLQLANIMEGQAADSDELLEKLLWQRNHSMAAKIEQLMTQHSGKQLFIVVGAGHIVGRQAIPDLLKQQGFTLTQCQEKLCD
ncbi:TraB/GumN family protein [Shewanella maritima]|uniref:TraB/GumN family protein n=1 Tax=Shewanella maritima TaxID=2520507 RepID=UPI003736293F